VGKAFPRIYVVEGRLLVIHANQENSHRLITGDVGIAGFFQYSGANGPICARILEKSLLIRC
jgi:hypothetical protein